MVKDTCPNCGGLKDRRSKNCKSCVLGPLNPRLTHGQSKDPNWRREKTRAWNAANRDRAAENNIRWIHQNNKRYKQTQAEYRHRNRQLIREKQVIRNAVPERAQQLRDDARRWAKENPDKRRQNESRRRARLLGSDVRVITKQDWTRLCNRFDQRCAYCGRSAALTMDHVIPLVRGGRHAIGNLLPACLSCNSSKNDQLLIEWRGRP